jgi:hypothetical protein
MNLLQKYKNKLEISKNVSSFSTSANSSDNQIFTTDVLEPLGLAISDGYLYVASCDPMGIIMGSYNILKFNLSYPYDCKIFTTNLVYPSGLAISDGYLYVTTYDYFFTYNSILKINLFDPFDKQIFTTNVRYPSGLAISNGNLYVTHYDTGIRNYNILKFNLFDPSDYTIFTTNVLEPLGLAISDGHLYVGNVIEEGESFNILKFNLFQPSDPTIFTTNVVGPLGLTISDGYLYVGNIDAGTIGKFRLTDSNLMESWSVTTPFGLAISDGNLYVSNIEESSIELISLPPPPPTPTPTPTPTSNICFPAGTPILTNQGIISIEQLNPEIHTIRNKKIVGITKTITQDKFLVCFAKDSLAQNIPSQQTIISQNHCLFYQGKMIQAKKFIDSFEHVTKMKYTGEILYNVLMEEHEKMVVNNLICETLHPENGTAKLYRALQKLTPSEQVELIKKSNEYAIKNKVFTSKSISN